MGGLCIFILLLMRNCVLSPVDSLPKMFRKEKRGKERMGQEGRGGGEKRKMVLSLTALECKNHFSINGCLALMSANLIPPQAASGG